MKLAEALLEKSAVTKRIEELRNLIVTNGMAQEGDTPFEDPIGLLEQFEECSRQLIKLERAIVKTNSSVMINNLTISQCIAEKSILKQKASSIKHIIDSCKPNNRYSRSEIKNVILLDLKNLTNQYENITNAVRKIETQLAQTNWQTDLIE
jgi:hypothetical protein